MLGNGYKPIGTVFTLLYGGPITGSFSDIEGFVFDGGRERYVVTYNRSINAARDVTATVESNASPEPSSLFLALFGLGLLLVMAKAGPQRRL